MIHVCKVENSRTGKMLHVCVRVSVRVCVCVCVRVRARALWCLHVRGGGEPKMFFS
jgi:hypothetical protein